MAVFNCNHCGAPLEVNVGATTCICKYCTRTQTLPRLENEKKINLYNRANHFRLNGDFDKAMGICELILNEDTSDAEAYWSLVLCRYGIAYVEDPKSHKRMPTINRVQYTSVFDDEDYKSALKYADGAQKAVYEAEAKTINEIQKGFLAISQKEEPFDVFICYKETDANGRRTQDSVLAHELYNELTREGLKVFYARVTLEDKLGAEYEPYIFAALNSAKVMVVIGTKPEHLNAVWVKNEWSRYLALIKNGAKKTLIPAFRDMNPYDLPEEFAYLQALDMAKVGFMVDLVHGVKKLVGADKPEAQKADNAEEHVAKTYAPFVPVCGRKTQRAYELVMRAVESIYSEGISPRLNGEDFTLRDMKDYIGVILQYSVLQVIICDRALAKEEAEFIAGLARYGDLHAYFSEQGFDMPAWEDLYGRDTSQLKDWCKKCEPDIKQRCSNVEELFDFIGGYDAAKKCCTQFVGGVNIIIKEAATQGGKVDKRKITACVSLCDLLLNMKSGVRRKRKGQKGANESYKEKTSNNANEKKGDKVNKAKFICCLVAIILIIGTVIALYAPEKAEIFFEMNGGDGYVQSQRVRIGKNYKVPNNTGTKENYRFAGWSTTSGGAIDYYVGDTILSVSGNIILYAVWEEANHVPVMDAAVEPTCSTAGKTEGSHCSLCGEVIVEQQIVPTTEHTAGAWIAEAQPTCTKKGSEIKKCTVCGTLVARRDVAALGHTEVADAAVASSCTTAGKTAGSHCSVCNIVIIAQQAVLPTGHSVVVDAATAPTCSAEGKTEGSHCSVCNTAIVRQNTVPKIDHTYAVTVVAATVTAQGYTEHKCSACGVSYKDNWVNMLPQPGSSEGLTFAFDTENQTYTVTGIGSCADTKIVIPNVYNGHMVTGIGAKAFKGCSGIVSITIPNCVTSVGDYAFKACKKLAGITIPDSVISIGNNAFESCSALTAITIPNSVTTIGEQAFYCCSKLTTVIIPDSVTSIGKEAFGISGLKSVTISKNVTTISSSMFYACDDLTNVIIPDGVTCIESYAFWNCKNLTSVTIPNSVTSIGYQAFRNCKSLTSIIIPNNVTSIGKHVFKDCQSLTGITIPQGVTSIGESAFEDCTVLKNVTISRSVTAVGVNAFLRCEKLESITFLGTRSEWKNVQKGKNWSKRIKAIVVHCTDGDVAIS